MHGRIKVKTTAEQEEEKRSEQQRKLKIFRTASALAFHKITSKEYDDAGLEVTGEILSRNSDFSSLWNYRKRAFLSLKNDSKESFQTLCDKELELLAACLRNNPKSYGCWHHRCFVMLHTPTPDWEKELKLCNQFLQFDDRNFHCWDYRRFVVKNSTPRVEIEDEIKVTEHLIETNFSNYSSWHYRSKLLPKKFPSSKSQEQIEEKKLLEELEYVQNAFFTDPNDQSAWFYHQWLIGRGEQEQKLIFAHFDRNSYGFTFIFKNATSQSLVESDCMIIVEGDIVKGKWKPVVSDFIQYCNGWVFECEDKISSENLFVIFEFFSQKVQMNVDSESIECSKPYFSENEFCQVLGDGKLLLLKSELGSLSELNDLEPGNKWVILTLVQLMNVIDPERYKEDINKYVLELQDIDPSRRSYFADLQSKILIEQSGIFKKDVLDLSNLDITRLYHLQYFCCIRILDLTKNKLTSLSGPLYLLLCCEQLLADDNEIADITGVSHMPKLVSISLKANSLTDVDQLKSLSTCCHLKTVDVRQNSFKSSNEGIRNVLQNIEVLF